MSDKTELLHHLNVVLSRAVTLLDDPEFRQGLKHLAQSVLHLFPPESPTGEPARRFDPSDAVARRFDPSDSVAPNGAPLAAPAPFDRTPPDSADISSLDSTEHPVGPTVKLAGGSPAKPSEPTLSAAEAVRRLTLGRGGNSELLTTPAPVVYPQSSHDALDELSLIRQRCQLKAEAARWAAERRRRLQRHSNYAEDISPIDQELIQRAKALDGCYLWTNNPQAPEPHDLSAYEALAEAFERMDLIVGLLETVLTEANALPHLKDTMFLAAEVQSSLRYACQAIGYEGMDSDQVTLFRWLREQTNERGIFISRFMVFKDLATPEITADLPQRIADLEVKVRGAIQHNKEYGRLLAKVRFETKRLEEEPADAAARVHKILDALDELVPAMLPPSHVELRSLLLPVLDNFIELDESRQGSALVLREIDAFLARNPEQIPDEPESADFSEAVAQLRVRLSGQSMLVICGERRPMQQAAIRAAFDLKEVIWETIPPHTPLPEFLPAISRPDVAVVLLAIRWSSHQYTELARVCKQFGKPLVRLPAGNNANQIAHRILAQAGKRLALVES